LAQEFSSDCSYSRRSRSSEYRSSIDMQLLMSMVCFLVVGASRTHIEAQDLCDNDCKMVNRVLDFPEYVEGSMPQFNFSVNAMLTEAISFSWRYSLSATIGPTMAYNASGVACSDTVVGDNVWFRFEMNLPDCKSMPGAVAIGGNFSLAKPVSSLLPIHYHFNIIDDAGARVFGMVVHFSHASGSHVQHDIALPLLDGRALGNVPASTSWPAAISSIARHSRSWISMRNCCDATCLLQNVSLDYLPHPTHGHHEYQVKGMLSQSIESTRFGLHGLIRKNDAPPQTILLGNGSFCGVTTTGDHAEYNLELNPGSCPIAAGRYVLMGRERFTLPLDVLGNLSLRTDITDDAGTRIACIESTKHFGTEADPAIGISAERVIV